MWINFLKAIHSLKKGICWEIGNGKSVITGVDPFIEDKDNSCLSLGIIEHLDWINMKTMDLLKNT